MQTVRCIGTMIIFFMMPVDELQSFRQHRQSLVRHSGKVIAGGQRPVRSRNLIPVTILLEKAQSLLRIAQRKAVHRQVILIDQPQQTGTFGLQ